jgi:hypothetical protein
MEDEETREEVDWSEYGDHQHSTHAPLDAKDYVAIFIAALQSIFLPLVILAVVLLSMGIIFAFIP